VKSAQRSSRNFKLNHTEWLLAAAFVTALLAFGGCSGDPAGARDN